VDRSAIPELRWQRQAHLATILGAVVTAGSLVFGLLTYQRSAADQREVAALGVLQEYLKLAVEHPDLASRGPDEPVEPDMAGSPRTRCSLPRLFGVSLATTRDGREPSPQYCANTTAIWNRVSSPGGDFTPEFVKYLQTRVRTLKCAS
jgi:hypothetical protein